MSANVTPSKPAKPSATKKTGSKGSKSSVPVVQTHVCSEPGCGKVCRTARGLDAHRRAAHSAPPVPAPIESPAVAVERVLATIEVTPRRAVLAATVRELAKALEDCEPTDKAKTSKELTARMADLLAETDTSSDAPDWTEADE